MVPIVSTMTSTTASLQRRNAAPRDVTNRSASHFVRQKKKPRNVSTSKLVSTFRHFFFWCWL